MEKEAFLKRVNKIKTIDEFSLLLEEINRPLPLEEKQNRFNDLKSNKNINTNLSVIFSEPCTEKEAYRREFNKPCPYCGAIGDMDSIVLDIVEENGIYKLKKICSRCHKTFLTEGNKIKNE